MPAQWGQSTVLPKQHSTRRVRVCQEEIIDGVSRRLIFCALKEAVQGVGGGRRWQGRGRKLGNTGAFCAHGRGGGCFGAGRAFVPAARGVLGTNRNHCDYTIVAGGSAEGVLVAFRRDWAWSGSWRDCRESLRAACFGVWR